jgi:beta-glucosidase
MFMAQAAFHFPRGFMWGTATAAHQVEGNNNNNNWWAWEQDAGHIQNGQKSGLACDWWNGRWREDFDRAAGGGQNAHRMSVEWSRVQPTPDRWDEDALDRYREMVRGLLERGLTPMVTLHHFSDPLWLSEMGGWENDEAPGYFDKYVRKTVEALREYVTLWCTINEPNVYTVSGYILGDFPPGKKDLRTGLKVAVNLLRGHAAAYRAIHSLQPQSRVGLAIHFRLFQGAKSWLPLDKLAAGLQNRFFNEIIPSALSRGVLPWPASTRLPEAKGTQDYLGINYYTKEMVAFNLANSATMFGRGFFRKEAELSETGFIANEPEGLFEIIKWGRQFNLPMIITENGAEGADDSFRQRYLIEHIHQVWRAVNFNWPVKGYFYWTLVDNFEWERGWTQRFGLWELDNETQVRRRRPSVDLYAEICRENGLTSETVARYAPELSDKIFP